MPLLPTTSFLLLAAMCYAKSSPQFYSWLINHRWFGEDIRNFRDGRGIRLRDKVLAVTTLCLTMGYSIGFIVTQLWIQLLLAAIGMAVTAYLLRLKIRRDQ